MGELWSGGAGLSATQYDRDEEPTEAQMRNRASQKHGNTQASFSLPLEKISTAFVCDGSYSTACA